MQFSFDSDFKKIEKCKTLKDDYYKYVEFGSEIPRQGWKIHISSNLDSYQIVLRLIVEYCTKYKIDFKYIYNNKVLKYFLSSDCFTTQAGKLYNNLS